MYFIYNVMNHLVYINNKRKTKRPVIFYEIPTVFSYLVLGCGAHCGGRYRGCTLRATDSVHFYGNQRFYPLGCGFFQGSQQL